MTTLVKSILKDALRLSPNDRAALVESLIGSLDQPDPSVDALWVQEAQDRIAAYHSGELTAIDAKTAFSDLGQPL
ncbi:addiction module protein [Castellaniella sp.]|uniref:addiction module protein n=1 Tax=Castellaniella sp. TaxID=1955812 RepID=UPI002AFDD7F2|nr:addiction module protein [Castellaniella sp.]